MKELYRGLQKKENGETLIELMKSIDTDGSGEINYTEFLAATIDASIFLKEEYLKTAFKMFDTDGNGKIDQRELRQILEGDGLGNHMSKSAIKKAIK